MIARLRQWFASRTLREQRLVLAAGGLAVIILAWLLVVRPIDLALENAKQRHDRAVIARAQALSQAEAIAAAQELNRTRPQGAIRDIIANETARAGFNVSQTQMIGNNGVRVIIGAVRPQAFFAWVSDLELWLGLEVEALTARPNADETLAVDVTFRGGR